MGNIMHTQEMVRNNQTIQGTWECDCKIRHGEANDTMEWDYLWQVLYSLVSVNCG